MDIKNLVKIGISVNSGMGLFANTKIKKNTRIFHFEGRLGEDRFTNSDSLQIDENIFLESTIGFDDFLNHSCSPNCFIDWTNLDLVSLVNITEGEELTYDYNTSEYDLVNIGNRCDFECKCKSMNCIGHIKGFLFLNQERKKEISQFLSPFLKTKLNNHL